MYSETTVRHMQSKNWSQWQTKKWEFFVVPGNGQPLLGMPDIETLGVLTVICNTIDMQVKNEQIYSGVEIGWQRTNKTWEGGQPEKYNVNIAIIWNLNSNDNPVIIDDNNGKTKYFIPGQYISKNWKWIYAT